MDAKVCGWRVARSERILRSISMLAFFRAGINLEYLMPMVLRAELMRTIHVRRRSRRRRRRPAKAY